MDTDPASPGYGRVWVAYNWLRDPVTGIGMRVLCSRDHGLTWSEVQVPPLEQLPDWWEGLSGRALPSSLREMEAAR